MGSKVEKTDQVTRTLGDWASSCEVWAAGKTGGWGPLKQRTSLRHPNWVVDATPACCDKSWAAPACFHKEVSILLPHAEDAERRQYIERLLCEANPTQSTLQAHGKEIEARLAKQLGDLAADQDKRYKDWLQQGVQGGMRPLYRAISKAQRVVVRPLRELPASERPSARRKQWVAIWGKASEAPGINQTLLEAAKDKAGSLDGLACTTLRALPAQGLEGLASALNLAEATNTIPQQWAHHQVALLPKNQE